MMSIRVKNKRNTPISNITELIFNEPLEHDSRSIRLMRLLCNINTYNGVNKHDIYNTFKEKSSKHNYVLVSDYCDFMKSDIDRDSNVMCLLFDHRNLVKYASVLNEVIVNNTGIAFLCVIPLKYLRNFINGVLNVTSVFSLNNLLLVDRVIVQLEFAPTRHFDIEFLQGLNGLSYLNQLAYDTLNSIVSKHNTRDPELIKYIMDSDDDPECIMLKQLIKTL